MHLEIVAGSSPSIQTCPEEGLRRILVQMMYFLLSRVLSVEEEEASVDVDAFAQGGNDPVQPTKVYTILC